MCRGDHIQSAYEIVTEWRLSGRGQGHCRDLCARGQQCHRLSIHHIGLDRPRLESVQSPGITYRPTYRTIPALLGPVLAERLFTESTIWSDGKNGIKGRTSPETRRVGQDVVGIRSKRLSGKNNRPWDRTIRRLRVASLYRQTFH